MYKNATKCNETIGKWCKNKHGASKIIDTFETYQKLTANRRCTSKSAYQACLQDLYDLGEPKPRQVSPITKQIHAQVWKNKKIIPRIQAFAWCFLGRAIPTGASARKYSKHISKLYCRCDLEEDDFHLFLHVLLSKQLGLPLLGLFAQTY
jgi:hypothetical protein